MKKTFFASAVILVVLLLAGCVRSELQTAGGEMGEAIESSAETERTITISCAGDCTLGTDFAFGGVTLPVEAENQGDYTYFLRNVKPYFEDDDLTIVNFEGTLTDRGSRADKTFAFRGNPEYTQILTSGSVEAVTLANNHSRDYGEESFEDTKRYLEETGIIWFENLNTKVTDVNGVKVGLVGLYALNGSAEGNLPKAMDKVKADGAELIVVQVHWGIEGNNYPESSQIELAHTAIDLDADLVMGHHPHVLQGVEQYKGKMIAYSLGNFCFGGNQNPRDKDTMIFRQSFTVRGGKVIDSTDYAVIPCSISSTASRNNYQPTPAQGSEKARIADKIQSFSDELGDIELKIYREESPADESERDEAGTDNIQNKPSSMIL